MRRSLVFPRPSASQSRPIAPRCARSVTIQILRQLLDLHFQSLRRAEVGGGRGGEVTWKDSGGGGEATFSLLYDACCCCEVLRLAPEGLTLLSLL
jgi:hypothetical protein